jgi:hypothetical protein
MTKDQEVLRLTHRAERSKAKQSLLQRNPAVEHRKLESLIAKLNENKDD